MAKHRKRREPKLSYSESRGAGWYSAYRDPDTGKPKRKRFGMIPEDDARRLYRIWLLEHMDGIRVELPSGSKMAEAPSAPSRPNRQEKPSSANEQAMPGSLLHVASSLIKFEEARSRQPGEPRKPGSISHRVLIDRKKHIRSFLEYLNERHGGNIVGRLALADLEMQDIEAYNASLVQGGYSASHVSKRMQMVKAVINRAGRPEHGAQVLSWNWDARDTVHGAPTRPKVLPTLAQLKRILQACDERGQAMVWMGIGLGFGQSDLAEVRVGQIDAKGYDLRRGKTGIERYGDTPPKVWQCISDYMMQPTRQDGALMFTTKQGFPLVHERSDSVYQWWDGLRTQIGESKHTLSGFYVLRHLGATEFGSREGCSISAMKRWLGHAASSAAADIYMKPVTPEHRVLIQWVRGQLCTGSK